MRRSSAANLVLPAAAPAWKISLTGIALAHPVHQSRNKRLIGHKQMASREIDNPARNQETLLQTPAGFAVPPWVSIFNRTATLFCIIFLALVFTASFAGAQARDGAESRRSEEHTSELQSHVN